MRLRHLSPLLAPVAAYVCSMPATAHAAQQPAYVLEISTDDADDQAKALTAAIKARLRAGGSKDVSLAEGDVSLAVLVLALKCPGDVPDPTCQNKIAEKLNAQAYIWGTMRKAPNNQVTADLRFYQKGKPEVRQQLTFTDNLTEPNDPALQRIADQLILRLTEAGKVGVARVTADHSIAGQLFVDGSPVGPFSNGQSELTLPIGDHKFEVKTGDKVVAVASGKVTATSTVDLQLGPPPKTGASEGGSSGNWKKTAGYVGVGVGGALLLGGVYSMLKVNSINHDSGFDAYRKGFGPNEDICKRAGEGQVSNQPGASSPADAKSLCDSGSTFTTLQYVLLPVGAIAAGAGVYFLATANKEGSSSTTTGVQKVEVLPAVGKGGGQLDVRVRF